MARFERALIDGIHVLRPIGDFSDSEAAEALHMQLSDYVGSPEGRLVLNWERIEGVKALALGAIKLSTEKCASQGGCVRHCAVTGRNRKILELSGLSQLFELFETEREAIESFGGSGLTTER